MSKKFFVLLMVIILLQIGCAKIKPQERGVLIRNFAIIGTTGLQPKPLTPGWHFINPVTSEVVIYDIRVNKYTMASNAEESDEGKPDAIDCKTSDGQNIAVDVTVSYTINPDSLFILHDRVGKDFIKREIRPRTRSIIQNIIGQYTSTEVYQGQIRMKAEKEAYELLSRDVQAIGLNVDAVLIRNFSFSSAFEEKIQQKILAIQEVEVRQQEVKAAQELARKGIERALGEAEEKKIQVDVESYKQTKDAEGILEIDRAKAEGQRLLAEALGGGSNVVALEYAKRIPDKLQIWGIPTGSSSISLMDLSGIFNKMLPPGVPSQNSNPGVTAIPEAVTPLANKENPPLESKSTVNPEVVTPQASLESGLPVNPSQETKESSQNTLRSQDKSTDNTKKNPDLEEQQKQEKDKKEAKAVDPQANETAIEESSSNRQDLQKVEQGITPQANLELPFESLNKNPDLPAVQPQKF